ncbi:MAG: Fpg/Nei family DNA glycosylase [Sporichthyaceae bacterium]
MPEGHTVHALAERLHATLGGGRVAASSPQGRFEAGAALVDGSVLRAAEACGKHLWLHFGPARGGHIVHVHLGLFGKFAVVRADPDRPVRGQVRLRLVARNHVAELRGPTACAVVTPAEVESLKARLGPDPLRTDADPTAAFARIGRSKRPIGELLMDQAVLAGVGNVYRSEVLHRLALDPATPGRDVPDRYLKALWADLVLLMPLGVATGRILTREEDVEGAQRALAARRRRPGTHIAVPRPAYEVYRRTGLPCRRCGTEVTTALAAGRNLFWCPGCQLGPDPG